MSSRIYGALAATLLMAGCALTPHGTSAERQKLHDAGAPYEPKPEDRQLPELSERPDWREVLHRAFLANGELEAAYFEWKIAVNRIDIASAYPNSNLALGYSYTFSSERMKTFDRMSFTAGIDSMENLSFPTKVMKAGEVALDHARIAAQRFRSAKFDLQQRVLTAWADYGLIAEKQRVQRENVRLLRVLSDTARSRVEAGAAQDEMLRAEVTYRTAEDTTKSLDAELTAARARLNALLGRPAGAALAAPPLVADPRVRFTDEQALAAGVDQNPDLAAFAHEVTGREDALELARMQWIPDINPSLGITGGITQAVGFTVMLPTTIVKIRGAIREAEAMQRSSEAMLRQTRTNKAANYVATLVVLRNSERRAELFQRTISPLAERMIASQRQTYAAGRGAFSDIVEGFRTLLDTRLMVAEALADRDKRLAELESLAGVDLETLGQERATHAGAAHTEKELRHE